MSVTLTITEGPHSGRTFEFDRHDTFLVGRTKECHFQLSFDDPYFSRRHFLIEINPPRCRVMDLRSRNGIFVNGEKVDDAELKDGDEVRAGHTVFRVSVQWPRDPNDPSTLTEPRSRALPTVEHVPIIPSIPGYRLEKEIGRGFMGVVYRATREADDRLVAIKVIAPVFSIDTKQVGRFVREAQILGELKHPNIVGFIEAGHSNPYVYLAMEYLTGPDVSQVVEAKGAMKSKTAVRLICQVLQGLQFAHDSGFVHRDIKPANIILNTEDGKRVAKIADFGLARVFESSKMSGLTMQGEVGGTPAFMAPEQVTHYRDVTPLADQYSVAATLYNLLTAEYPYDLPKKMANALVRILTSNPIPILERMPDLEPGLASAIERGMSKEPEARFENAAAFAQELLPFC